MTEYRTMTFYAQIRRPLRSYMDPTLARTTSRKPKRPEAGTVIVPIKLRIPRQLFDAMPTVEIEVPASAIEGEAGRPEYGIEGSQE